MTNKTKVAPMMSGNSRTSASMSALRLGVVALAAVLLAAATAVPAYAQERRPLLAEGKKTIFQRVVTRPQAMVSPAAGAAPQGAALPTFSVFYVFARQTASGKEWLEVGHTARGRTIGWIPADKAIDWKQTIVVAFGNSAERKRTLVFDERQPLVDLLGSEGVVSDSDRLRREFLAGRRASDSHVIAIEPENVVDINEKFYLLPILQAEEVEFSSGFPAQILQIAAIPLQTGPTRPNPADNAALRDYSVGITFVVDTTISMEPYIERTRNAIREILNRIGGSEHGARVSFGVIGFRNDVNATPDLEYRTYPFVLPQRGTPAATVLAKIADIHQAGKSSVSFAEDSMAGIREAIRQPRWDDFGGRYIILVTDASALGPTDPHSFTRMAPRDMNTEARDKQIAIYSLHLRTPQGRFNHDLAEKQYKDLSKWDNGRSLYYPIAEGSEQAFASTVKSVSDAVIGQIGDTLAGRLSQVPQRDDSIAGSAAAVGRAMQMAYLARTVNTPVPDVFLGWMSDRDTDDPRKSTLDVRMLMTKSQLATLRDVARAIIETAEGSRRPGQEQDFFNRLRSAVALMSRDPDRVVDAQFRTLGDALGEFLEGLPYRSEILNKSEADWVRMGAGAQRELIDDLTSKIALYEGFHSKPKLWQPLYPQAPEGERVFAVPLSALP